jgi:hypothetical protein
MIDLPDEPRWVEAHGLAREATSWKRPLGDGFAIGNDAAKLAVIAGRVEAEAVLALANEHPTTTLILTGDDLASALRATRPRVERAILHTLPDPSVLPDLDGASQLPDDASLAHVNEALVEELAAVRGRMPIWTSYVDGAPVSFAYAPWRSGHWFDVSVDTIPAARQLGLGTIVAAAMIRDERAHGREPVWGAYETNTPSLRLAQRLGFVPVDEIWVASP